MPGLAKRSLPLSVAICTGLLAACSGGGSGSNTSSLNLGISDAPIDSATKVWIQFTGVEVKPVNGNPVDFNFSPAKGIDVLALQGGNAAPLLQGVPVPAGQYEWVRLMVDTTAGSSYIVDDTGQHSLVIPSGAESGLKLIQGFTMPVGGAADFTIDFELSKSIIAPPGMGPDYMLKPVLRMVNNLQVGTIAGTFQASTLTAPPQTNCGTHAPVVYLYPGSPDQVMPDDLYNPAPGATDTEPTPPPGTPALVEPLTTAIATLNSSSLYAYSIAFVPTGTYTVAFTCDNDDPGVDESDSAPLHFTIATQAVTVTANQTTTANF